MKLAWALTLALSGTLSSAALAQEVVPPAPLPIPESAAAVVAAGTVVELELAEPLTSKLNKRGDKFAIRLAEPIRSKAGILIPAGATGVGEVISAAKAGMLGKPGELLLAARYLEYNGERVPLRTFRMGASGKNNAAVVMAASFVIPLAFVIPGGDIEMPAGARANAKLTGDLVLPVAAALAAEPAPTDTTTTTLSNQEPSS